MALPKLKKSTEPDTKNEDLPGKVLTPGDKDEKKKKIASFLNKFTNGDSFASTLDKVDSNRYVSTGLYMMDLVYGKGLKYPVKQLLFGREHVGKTSLYMAISSNYLEYNPDAYIAYLDLDYTIDKDYVESAHKLSGEKATRFVYMKAKSVEHAFEMFETAMKESLFDVIIADPWNMIARQSDVEKSGMNLVGKTRTADRAGANCDFFRTKSALMDSSNTSFWFAEHETTDTTSGSVSFAGGSAIKGAMENINRIRHPYKSGREILDKETNTKLVSPIEIVVVKNKLSNNKDQKYILYFHKNKGYLSVALDRFAFLEHFQIAKSKGAYVYLDHPETMDVPSFYFSAWESVYEKNQILIEKVCRDLWEKHLKAGKES